VNSNRSTFLALASALIISVGSAHAQSVGFTAEVLTKGAGARPLAMGGAFVAAANDATAAYWNPAGLGLVDDVQITTMHWPNGTFRAMISSISPSRPLMLVPMP